MTAFGAFPALAGGWIRTSQRSEDQLSIELEGMRRKGLVYAGEIVFIGVTSIEIESDRPMSRPPADPRPTGTIVDANAATGVTVLDTWSQSWPGEADSLRFIIRHTAIDVRLRPSFYRTVRGLVGFYPLPRIDMIDLRPTPFSCQSQSCHGSTSPNGRPFLRFPSRI